MARCCSLSLDFRIRCHLNCIYFSHRSRITLTYGLNPEPQTSQHKRHKIVRPEYHRCAIKKLWISLTQRAVAHSEGSAPSRNSDFGSLAQIVKVRKRRNLALNTDSANCRTFYVRRMRNREGVARARVGPPSDARWFQFLPINPTLINLAVASVSSVTLHCSRFKPCLREH